jgi:hypothetical protein
LNANNTEAARRIKARAHSKFIQNQGQEDKQKSDSSFVTRCN